MQNENFLLILFCVLRLKSVDEWFHILDVNIYDQKIYTLIAKIKK